MVLKLSVCNHKVTIYKLECIVECGSSSFLCQTCPCRQISELREQQTVEKLDYVCVCGLFFFFFLAVCTLGVLSEDSCLEQLSAYVPILGEND